MIDVHSHYLPQFLVDALTEAGRTSSIPKFPAWSVGSCVELMEEIGVRASILSVSTPGVHFGNDRQAAALARRCNEFCAELFSTTDRKLGGFAALPLPAIDAAMAEMAYALDVLKLDGVGLLANYEGRFLGDSFFDLLMAELDQRGAVAFIHPMGHASSRALQLSAPLWMVEYPIDTTRAALNLIINNIPQRFPKIRFILAHAGGALPFLAGRIGAASLIDSRYEHLDDARVARDVASFYYETAQASSAASFAALREVASPERMLFGSDFPYCGKAPIRSMLKQLGPNFDAAKADLAANSLFPRFATLH